MNEFKGTKGKWFACCLDTQPHYVFDENSVITICKPIKEQEMCEDLSLQEFRANTLLISKAPEMLEMLERVLTAKFTCEEIKQLIKEATEL